MAYADRRPDKVFTLIR
ncbi:TPA: hypothetical protein ACGR51_004023 [Escherichia coli]